MIKNWWAAREPREKLLLSICLVLTLTIVLFQFIFGPSVEFRDRASKRYLSQASSHSEVVQTLRVYENSPRQVNAVSAGPVQGVVSDSSAVFGIDISRIEPTSNGDLTLWIEEIDPQSLYAWLTDLEINHGISVNKASIRMNKDTVTVNANVLVSRGN
ncbi:type II secretion system protein GspM [Hirschia baltica]|uniref:General secretion pathway M protein n=1 Tax=Hirschia baltica (strain ATCC 49814 / DSM 5838 / IFAM 1418) TaxID=582402 RepID=C6XJ56_HIRBI|nr:type II secretion system protein GspM [Hirschia baltica]ACT59151.1 General secretion pathway M protein [Hirschia baltica ATCC 49814]